MFSSPTARKFARLAVSSVAAGTALAVVLLGGPADAATFSHFASKGI